MNQLVFVFYSGTIQFQAERDLKMSRLSALSSTYLAKFMKHNKSNMAYLHEIIIIFSPVHLSEATYMISSFNLMAEFKELIANAIIIPLIDRSP